MTTDPWRIGTSRLFKPHFWMCLSASAKSAVAGPPSPRRAKNLSSWHKRDLPGLEHTDTHEELQKGGRQKNETRPLSLSFCRIIPNSTEPNCMLQTSVVVLISPKKSHLAGYNFYAHAAVTVWVGRGALGFSMHDKLREKQTSTPTMPQGGPLMLTPDTGSL